MTIDTRLEALGWHHLYSGKVRELYESPAHPGRLLVVTSDRVSAFDHVLSPGIPGKGALLTQLSLWWFGRLGEPTHLAAAHPSLGAHLPPELAGRTMIVHTLDMYPIECVVRGYLAGSGWAEYRATQTVCGLPLPPGLSEGDKLPEPIFTPAFKAPQGQHDENITFERMVEIVGAADAERLREASLRIFATASAVAEQRGILLADSKFEFGRDPGVDHPVLADEVLTSDSSRYWDAETYAAGGPDRLEAYDKQIVRDWLAANWDRTGEPPELPTDIVERTAVRYQELVDRFMASDA
ncbi:MAG: phosphoribosylaminoimidazolesuccinocarboxamide synthase [Pseudolysinimonas sp.]|jgi:phosphoribosylaminoimidazole-succinocarboxamide synthase|uniref:phosphoribosylaminoimidazolesuccinocarboxamide synthase n=1 Tax=Pseudolysinimonas sp. TaxID=2680009 RepID=UPI003C75A8D5